MAMEIVDGKTASDAITGCAPIDWVKSTMSDFALAWKQTVIDVKQIAIDFFYGIRGAAISLSEGWNWLWGKILNTPPVAAVARAVSYGVAIVRKGWADVDKCTKAVIASTAAVVGGTAAVIGGIFALCAVASAVAASLPAIIAITVSAGLLLRLFAGGVRFIYNFNWNQADTAIETEYQAKLAVIAGRGAEALGYAIGTVVCGFAVGTGIATFNPTLAMRVKSVYPELYEEMKAEIESSLRAIGNIGMSIMFKNVYKNVRRWIKKQAFRFPFFNSRIENAIRAWGSPSSKAWSFASATEEAIESIQNPILRNAVEQGVEGLFEGCDESIFTLAGGLS